jgi:hypothetical protein
MDEKKLFELMEGISWEESNERAEKLRLNNPTEFERQNKVFETLRAEINRFIRVQAAKQLHCMHIMYLRWPEILKKENNPKEADRLKRRKGGLAFESVAICLKHNFKIPKWCREAFVDLYKKVNSLETKNWEDILGPMYPKGMHLHPLRRFSKFGWAVYKRVNMLASTEGKPIDGEMFERVGRDFGIGGKTLTEEIYYKAKKKYGV